MKRDSVKDTAQQIAQKADTPTIQTDKKDTIAPLQQTVSEEPAAEQTTQLKIKGAPNGAYVYVDGKYFDKTPLKDATISIGEHAIKVVKEGYETYEKTHIFNSQSAAIDVNIKKSTVLLNLSTNPTGASVYVDGSYIGTSYISGYKVEQGTHKIMVKKTGYETFEHTYTFTSQAATINLTLTAKPKPQPQNKNTINGHEYVDLGLPSGLKWATCNVGASKPEEYGNHYAWGETSTKSSYTIGNSVTRGKKLNDIGGNPTYDVARKQWGSTWRLPTKAEFDELLSNCTWTWTTQNGIKGCKVTSKKNGNSIFLPAAGWRNGSSLLNQGTFGGYWSSTPHESYSGSAFYLDFSSGGHSTSWGSRLNGRSVRPVCK
ncbi:MAG: PEGA domain-containing protein [Clostridia bacterium]|nr:PEGA domain-containing protein [Clostridia bacterium]